ncbi:endonuclease/exonuclease/phosphatase family protein [Dactylosporangium sp. CA-092794]|uniref:endonuclease/exonuclease/phosphatase family protein n=1 Tax=Dactylosporangium sp. CA-092794 TaxID=3239929 RepID=UPI003D9476B7
MTVVFWVAAGLAAAFTAVRALGVARGTPLVQLVTYTPYAAVFGVAAGVAGLATGFPAPGAALLACGLALAALVAPRLVPAPPPGEGVRLRVMSANLLFGTGAGPALVDQAKVDDVDVLAVQELTADGLAALAAAGLDALLPHRVVSPAPGGAGSGLFSRHPIDEPGVRTLERIPMTQALATVHVPGAGPVLVECAHPYPPRPGRTGTWAAQLAAQPVPDPDAPPRVLLGDFNATLDHAPLRRLLRAGYRDAAAARGRGLHPTWPYRTVTLPFWTPPVTLDHVLADRRIGVREFGTRRTPGSDHRAVVAELVLRPPAG